MPVLAPKKKNLRADDLPVRQSNKLTADDFACGAVRESVHK